MVSALLKACSEGHLSAVQELLKDGNTLNIEAKDDSGSTPLIEAIRNGHVDIVRALLDRGADPLNASPNGLPEQHTSDEVILNLLTEAKNRLPTKDSTTESTFNPGGSDDTQKSYYPPPPPEVYPYYPTINPSLSTADGAMYYPPAQPFPEGHSPGGGVNNLPPPEIARLIPCRYFPACRYGPSCMFAHPTQGYYPPPGAPPHPQYPPYDHMAPPPYPPNYYPMQPPPFQPPNGPHPMSPISPSLGPHMIHARSQSEVVSPNQGPFSPNGVPPPPLPYGPMSPTSYPHPGQIPVPIPPIPPLHHPSTMPPPGPQSPTNFAPPNASPYGVPHDNSIIYSPQHPPVSAGPMNYPPENTDGAPKPLQAPSNDGLNNGIPPMHRDGAGHARRGGRRGSFTSRKPPCLFYPSGRCKNGDDCRFPHVMPDAPGAHHPPYFTGRGGGPRQPRGHPASNGIANGGLEEKFNNLNIRDESSRPQQDGSAPQPQQTQQNGQSASTTDSSKSSNASDNGHGIPNGNGNGINGVGHRPRFPPGGKHHQYHQHHGHNNHFHSHGKGQRPPAPVPAKQRVPNADEFPVLAGTVTPPSRTSLSGSGLTAAQVLQAPPPFKKDTVNGISRESSTRGTTPDAPRSPVAQQKDILVKAEVNGIIDNAMTTESSAGKLPMSFAAAVAPSATSPSAPDVSKEVSVSA